MLRRRLRGFEGFGQLLKSIQSGSFGTLGFRPRILAIKPASRASHLAHRTFQTEPKGAGTFEFSSENARFRCQHTLLS